MSEKDSILYRSSSSESNLSEDASVSDLLNLPQELFSETFRFSDLLRWFALFHSLLINDLFRLLLRFLIQEKTGFSDQSDDYRVSYNERKTTVCENNRCYTRILERGNELIT